ncbi:ABC transporter permease [Dyadobacter subterraneus]|uniref:ABC transporter permease n=1 Tax=Dyadobacter subterraneus TaxID=2773304 RepID=A0ABR9WH31_9BACT|nr:ABC transporter permease [Dyadobacter subterraneus]MBE9463656.1 ABC transporter permease [Dyadobacter subterraneus]
MDKITKNTLFLFIILAAIMTAGIFLLAFAVQELHYDIFITKPRPNQIYRLVTTRKTPLENSTSIITPCPSTFFRDNFTGISKTTQILYSKGLLSAQNTSFTTVDGWFADSSLFDIFTFTFIEGAPYTALNQPASIVLTEKTAFRFFGCKKALGKSLFFERMTTPLKVTGVVREISGNSQIKSNFYLSMSTFTKVLNPGIDRQIQRSGAITFVLLKDGEDKNQVEKNILALLQTNQNFKVKGTAMDYEVTLTPLINSGLIPLRRNYHVFGLGMLLVVAVLVLVKSVIYLARGTSSDLSISEKKLNISTGSFAYILSARVLFKSLLAFLTALLTVAGIILLAKLFFNFKIEAIFSAFGTATVIALISVILICIISSIWVALVHVFNPIETYFSKKKRYGQR